MAAHKWSEGDVTFDVHYCPAGDAEKMRAEDPNVWPGDYMREKVFTDFQHAEAFAIQCAANDWFGCSSISREVCEDPKYDWWEHTGAWEVMPDMKPGDLDPNEPHN